jgi:hypothetical protein
MKTTIYTPATAKIGNVQLVSISVGGDIYYPIYLLPMDAERGRDGFPTTPKTVEMDITAVIAQDYRGGLDEKHIANLSDDIKASIGIDTNLHSFAIEGMKGKVPCLTTAQLTQVILSYARKKDCEFCWDLLDVHLFSGLMHSAYSAHKLWGKK